MTYGETSLTRMYKQMRINLLLVLEMGVDKKFWF